METQISSPVICPCGTTVPTSRKKYCSDVCAHRYSVLIWQRRQRDALAASKLGRICVRCGAPFGAERRSDSTHCSRLCSARTNGKKKMARFRTARPDEYKQRKRASYLRHRDTYIKLVLKRRFKIIDAEPKWLSPEDRAEIKAIYRRALERSSQSGVPHEVDHVVPLQGKNVSGLHVPWNLQILPKRENRAKSNHVG